jgi:glutathione S-transferase
MTATITAFAASPDRGRGLARDMAVRWALAEAGATCRVRLLDFAALKQPDHKALQPFGQIPTWQDGSVTLFESGAIVLHIAETHAGLLPADPAARARAIAWMFAAVSTMEPVIVERETAVLLEHDQPWHAARLPLLDARVHKRLGDLAVWLDERQWLEEAFSAGDLMMICVLRRLLSSGLLGPWPTLAAYVARGEARPAFAEAFAAQRAVFLAAQRD